MGPEPYKGYQPSAQTSPQPYKGYQPPGNPEPYKGYQPDQRPRTDPTYGTNQYQPVGPSGPALNPPQPYPQQAYPQPPTMAPYPNVAYPVPPSLPPYPRYYDTDDVDYYDYGRHPAPAGPEYADISSAAGIVLHVASMSP